MKKTEVIPLDQEGVWQGKAIERLRSGDIIGVPTETVYGLAGDATRDDAIAAIYAAKARPTHNPLIVHVADLEMGERYGLFSDVARRLATLFWPGPLTLVVPLKEEAGLANAVTAGGQSLAIRCPQGPLGALAKALNRPLAAPSANRSGHVSPTHADHVREDLGGHITMILDGGPCRLGVESTIVDLRDEPRILRPGALSTQDLSHALNGEILMADVVEDVTPVAPGQLSSHYAPSVPVRLDVLPGDVEYGQAYLGFGDHALTGHHSLSPTGNVDEAASRLYAALRTADRLGATAICIAPIPDHGVGQAMANRLKRAAAPRD